MPGMDAGFEDAPYGGWLVLADVHPPSPLPASASSSAPIWQRLPQVPAWGLRRSAQASARDEAAGFLRPGLLLALNWAGGLVSRSFRGRENLFLLQLENLPSPSVHQSVL